MNLTYPAIVTPDTGGSKEDALAHAPAALETALEFYTEAGEDLPTPSEGRPGDYMVSVSSVHPRQG